MYPPHRMQLGQANNIWRKAAQTSTMPQDHLGMLKILGRSTQKPFLEHFKNEGIRKRSIHAVRDGGRLFLVQLRG